MGWYIARRKKCYIPANMWTICFAKGMWQKFNVMFSLLGGIFLWGKKFCRWWLFWGAFLCGCKIDVGYRARMLITWCQWMWAEMFWVGNALKINPSGLISLSKTWTIFFVCFLNIKNWKLCSIYVNFRLNLDSSMGAWPWLFRGRVRILEKQCLFWRWSSMCVFQGSYWFGTFLD